MTDIPSDRAATACGNDSGGEARPGGPALMPDTPAAPEDGDGNGLRIRIVEPHVAGTLFVAVAEPGPGECGGPEAFENPAAPGGFGAFENPADPADPCLPEAFENPAAPGGFEAPADFAAPGGFGAFENPADPFAPAFPAIPAAGSGFAASGEGEPFSAPAAGDPDSPGEPGSPQSPGGEAFSPDGAKGARMAADLPEYGDLAEIAAVRFPGLGPALFFTARGLGCAAGDKVVVEMEEGHALGTVSAVMRMNPAHLAAGDGGPLAAVARKATEQDLAAGAANDATAGEALQYCRRCAGERGLDMKLVDVLVLLDRSKMVFYFTAPARIDFRDLVKDLVRRYRTRIELRQIGVRHETQMVGALGNCGMVCCCRRYLRKFSPVAIKMAKEQNVFLNPVKISGICGRLLCCLAYEQDHYDEFYRSCPKLGKKYHTDNGVTRVLRASLFRESVTVLSETGEELEYSLADWAALNPHRPSAPQSGPGKRQDPPGQEGRKPRHPNDRQDGDRQDRHGDLRNDRQDRHGDPRNDRQDRDRNDRQDRHGDPRDRQDRHGDPRNDRQNRQSGRDSHGPRSGPESRSGHGPRAGRENRPPAGAPGFGAAPGEKDPASVSGPGDGEAAAGFAEGTPGRLSGFAGGHGVDPVRNNDPDKDGDGPDRVPVSGSGFSGDDGDDPGEDNDGDGGEGGSIFGLSPRVSRPGTSGPGSSGPGSSAPGSSGPGARRKRPARRRGPRSGR